MFVASNYMPAGFRFSFLQSIRPLVVEADMEDGQLSTNRAA